MLEQIAQDLAFLMLGILIGRSLPNAASAASSGRGVSVLAPVYSVESLKTPGHAVVLLSAGSQKIKAIKDVREATGLGLREAKALVENAPVVIAQGLTADQAQRIVAAFQADGANAEVREITG